MLYISKPAIETTPNGHVKLKAEFQVNGMTREMWYATSPEYAEYFCDERIDAFVLPLLIYAMKHGLAVVAETPVSERLHYGIKNFLVKAFLYTFKDWQKVRLDYPVAPAPPSIAGGVGTGLSCGVDSFSTIAEHLSEEQTSGYRLTHLTFFNVGGHNPLANSNEKVQELFTRRIDLIRPCAEDLGLPLVVVDSNMEEILGQPFAPTHTFRSVSAVLAIQKLFSKYFYSSGHTIYDFSFNPRDSGDYDVFSLPMLATEGLEFFSTGAFYTRIFKTDLISKFPASFKHLNVCVFNDTNCSLCEKCMRTLLILDILGELEKYDDVFDVENYKKNRSWYIGQVQAQKDINPSFREIVNAMNEYHFHHLGIFRNRLAWCRHRLRNKIGRTLRR